MSVRLQMPFDADDDDDALLRYDLVDVWRSGDEDDDVALSPLAARSARLDNIAACGVGVCMYLCALCFLLLLAINW